MKKTSIVTLLCLAVVFVGMAVSGTYKVIDGCGNQTGICTFDPATLRYVYHHNGHCSTMWSAGGTYIVEDNTLMCVQDSGHVWGGGDPDGDDEWQTFGQEPFLSPATGGFTLKK